MSLQLEIRHLKLIKAIVEEGSVIRASERLNLTQSALSHQLKDIERRLKTALFVRLKKRLVLTAAGERLFHSAQKILADLKAVEEDVRHLGANKSGVLRVSTECYTCYHWLPAILKNFNREFPEVSVQIVVEATRKPLEALAEGKIDLAIISSTIKDKDFLSTPLFTDELVAVVSPEHHFASRTHLKAEDFIEEHLFTYSLAMEDLNVYKLFLLPGGIKPKQVSKIELTEAMIEMVKANLGIAILARWAVQPHIDNGALKALPLTGKGIYREWKAIIFSSQTEFPYVNYFISILQTAGMQINDKASTGNPVNT